VIQEKKSETLMGTGPTNKLANDSPINPKQSQAVMGRSIL
jgi:hypothetical protein